METNVVFNELMNVDVTPYLTQKSAGDKTLSYLSWPYAWAEIKKRYPDATYEIWRDDKGLPYAYDPRTGYMVYVTLKVAGQEIPCFLPVMDDNNRTMKDKGYNFTYHVDGTQYTEWVPPASMFDINKTIMRCLVKACAFAGLGLFVYAGEDINTFKDKVSGQYVKPVQPEPEPMTASATSAPVAETKSEDKEEIVVITAVSRGAMQEAQGLKAIPITVKETDEASNLLFTDEQVAKLKWFPAYIDKVSNGVASLTVKAVKKGRYYYFVEIPSKA